MEYSRASKYISVLLGLFILIPFKFKPFLVFIFFLFSVFQFFKTHQNKKKLIRYVTICLVLVSYLISFFYSSNLPRAFQYFIRSIPLFIIPLSFYFLSSSLKEYMINIFIKTFIVSNVIYVFLMVFYILSLGYLSESNDLYYYYSYITYEFYGIGDHPIYISVQLSLSILFLIKCNFRKNQKIILFIFLIFGIFLLSRKGVVFSLLFVLFIYLNQLLIKKRNFFIILSLVILAFLSSLLIPQIKMRYAELFERAKYKDNDKTSTGIRTILWENTIELIQENPFFGHGIGDTQDLLRRQLEEKKFIEIANKKPNCHNQYLQFLLSVGILGLSFFIFTVVYYFKYFNNNNNVLGFIVLLFFLLNFLSESFLDRQNGIIIFSLFMSILVSYNDKNMNKENIR